MENDQAEGLITQIDTIDPDLVFLVETDSDWRTRLQSIEDRYPFNHLLPLPDFNGMLLYSKYPIENVEERRLVQDHIPSLRVDLTLDDSSTVRLFCVHPRPPRPEDATEDMDKELMLVADQAFESPHPTLVMGDLNDVGWSPTTRKFLKKSGLQDPRRGRGLYNTFNAKNILTRWPLDHIFHSDEFSFIEIRRLEKFGSDHFPIYAKFSLMTDAQQ